MRERDNYWLKQRSTPLDRRRLFSGAAAGAAGLAGLSLVGCGNDDEEGEVAEAAEGLEGNTQEIDVDLETFREMYHGRHLRDLPHADDKPERGGVFRFASGGGTPTSWEPTGAGAQLLPSYVLMHNQLVRFKVKDDVENHNFQPVETDIAQTMPEQPDELTYVFKMSPGVQFADVDPVNGRALTPEDIKYSYEAYMDAPVQAPTFDEVRSIDIPDDETIVITTEAPAAYFLDTLVVPYHWIFSPEQHEQGGMDRNPIGTGPFILEREEELGGFVVERNPNYWKKDEYGTQLPYVDRVEVEFIPSPVDADASFRTGEIDHRSVTSYDQWRDIVRSNPNVVTQVTTPAPSAQPYFIMNLTKPPFDDVRVRRAMSLAIDRQSLIDDLASGIAGYGYGQDFTFFGREWPFGPEELGDWHNYNPDLAHELLADAGYEDGIPEALEVFNSQTAGAWFEVSVAAMEMWRNVGIQTDHEYSADPSQWQSLFYNATYEDMMLAILVGPGYDPDAFSYQALHSQATKNYFHVNDPDLDRLCEQQRREMDVETRQEILREIMNIDLDQVYRIWLTQPYKINIRHPHVYNAVDTHAAWGPAGWGSHCLEQTWLVNGGS